jgi:hypothetical protein
MPGLRQRRRDRAQFRSLRTYRFGRSRHPLPLVRWLRRVRKKNREPQNDVWRTLVRWHTIRIHDPFVAVEAFARIGATVKLRSGLGDAHWNFSTRHHGARPDIDRFARCRQTSTPPIQTPPLVCSEVQQKPTSMFSSIGLFTFQILKQPPAERLRVIGTLNATYSCATDTLCCTTAS